ncbi:ABC transporter substrate-binding protein [Qipengyuania seohaensis]|uniref:ABC transporter substrate-binding protein n=1 Tax=Qipengyuania seohaensis TaxID=266951 RepID=UPI001E434C57|nr:ABC transporter substrate-binding protein [Qipengyuania seohaensis]
MNRIAPALLLVLTACSGGRELRDEGSDRPTIVSLNPCTDAILAEVADPRQLLAISHYSKDSRASSMEPEVAARYPSTGGTVEEILALEPDIVVASTFIAPATRAALGDLGRRVETFGSVASVEASIEQVRQLARLTGDPERGEALVASIEGAIADAGAEGRPVQAAVWQPSGIVPGEGALISDLLRRTGFASYGAARGMAQADFLSLEQVVADPPEVLLIAGSDAGQRHPLLSDLPQMHRESFDTSLLYCGGPTIIRATERLKQIRQGAS